MPISTDILGSLDRSLSGAIRSGNLSTMTVNSGSIPHDFLHSINAVLFSANPSVSAILALAEGLEQMGFSDSSMASLDRGAEVAGRALDRGRILSARSRMREGTPLALADFVAAGRLLGAPAPRPPLSETSRGDISTLSIAASLHTYLAVRDAVENHPLREDALRDPWLVKPNRMSALDDLSGSMEDYSFLVMAQGRPVLHVECDVEGDSPLANLQVAIRLASLSPSVPQESYDVAIRHLRASAHHAGAPFILLETAPDNPLPPSLEHWLRQHGRSTRLLDEAWVDLGRSSERIERDFRETHRQQIRWGRKNLSVKRWEGENDYSLLADLERLCQISQRYVPNMELLRQRLRRQQAAFYVASLEGEVVSAMIVGRHGRTSYYEAGIAIRRGNAPLAHTLVAQAIMDAALEGQDRFFLGVLHTDEAFSDKLRSIASFKRGFTRSFRPIVWTAVNGDD